MHVCIYVSCGRYRRQQQPPVSRLGDETNVSYHVGDSPMTGRRVAAPSSADMQPDPPPHYVNAADLDPSLTDFDSVSKADSRSSGYQSVDGSASVWDAMSFDNPLFRAFSFRASGRRQLIESPAESRAGPSNQSTV